MNSQPHSHRVEITETEFYWHVKYGDQPTQLQEKPKRGKGESDAEFEDRCVAVLKPFVARIVHDHDRASMLAEQGLTITQRAVPMVRDGQWLSSVADNATANVGAQIVPAPSPPVAGWRRVLRSLAGVSDSGE